MTEELKHKLFSSTECISEKTMYDYIDNKLTAKEQHLVEKHMLDCDLCSDAMEGLRLLKNRDRVYMLNKAVLEKISKPEAKIFSINRRVIVSVAAGLLLLLGGVFFFNMFMGGAMKEEAMAELKEAPKDMSSAAESPPPPPVSMMDSIAPVTSLSGAKDIDMVSGDYIADAQPAEKISDLEESEQKQISQEITVKTEIKNTAEEGAVMDELKKESAPQSPAPDVDKKVNYGFAGTTSNTTTISSNNESNTLALEKSRSQDDKNKEKDVSKGNDAGGAGTFYDSKITETAGKRAENQRVVSSKSKSQKTENAKKAEERKEDKPQKAADVAGNGPVTTADQTLAQNNNIAGESAFTNAADSISFSGYLDANLSSFETVVDEAAEYPGGNAALATFVNSNAKWPLLNREDGISATKIYVQLIIGTDGSIKDQKVIKGINDAYDAEALRIVKLMPKWKPAKKNGKAVNYQFNLPIQLEFK